jgi:hypothetical protein
MNVNIMDVLRTDLGDRIPQGASQTVIYPLIARHNAPVNIDTIVNSCQTSYIHNMAFNLILIHIFIICIHSMWIAVDYVLVDDPFCICVVLPILYRV